MSWEQIIRQPATWWTANNPTLLENQLGVESNIISGVETDTGKAKLGNGVDAWASLAYFNPAGGASIGGTVTDATQGSVLFVGAGGVLAQDNANFYRSSSLFRVALSETQTDGAFRFKFAGWNGSGYTTGLVLESTDPLAYYGTHILLKNSAYNTTGLIAVNTPNGVSISSLSNGVVHTFNSASYTIGAFSDIAANPAFRLTVNTSTQAGQAITLAASQTADAFQVFASNGTTKLFAVDSGGVLITATKTPASATATGTTGMVAWDSGFIYVCTATNTWKKVAIATW